MIEIHTKVDNNLEKKEKDFKNFVYFTLSFILDPLFLKYFTYKITKCMRDIEILNFYISDCR